MWFNIILIVCIVIVLVVSLRLVYLRGVRRGALIVNEMFRKALKDGEFDE